MPPTDVICWSRRRRASPATLQVVARSVETALHKLHELGFDVEPRPHGYGTAPLPPVAQNDLRASAGPTTPSSTAAASTLWVRGDDEIARRDRAEGARRARRPTTAQPFAGDLRAAGRDFYKIDPLLFSPAEIVFHNLDTGRVAPRSAESHRTCCEVVRAVTAGSPSDYADA